MSTPPAPGRAATAQRALQSPLRGRILQRLAAQPLDARGLASALGVHVNTARSHLAALEDAGLVRSRPERRDRPGRPRLLYDVTPAGAPAPHDRGYRFLAAVLASYLAATAADPAAAAEEAGAGWGRYLVEQPRPFQRVAADAAVAEVVRLLDGFGFAPLLERNAEQGRVLLRRCPFLDVARDHPDVVCSVHLGLMRGALAGLGAEDVRSTLEPFVEPQLCVAHLEVRR